MRELFGIHPDIHFPVSTAEYAAFREWREKVYGGKLPNEGFKLGDGDYSARPYYSETARDWDNFMAGYRAAPPPPQSAQPRGWLVTNTLSGVCVFKTDKPTGGEHLNVEAVYSSQSAQPPLSQADLIDAVMDWVEIDNLSSLPCTAEMLRASDREMFAALRKFAASQSTDDSQG